MSDTEFDGCSRTCRKMARHTMVEGQCEHAPRPEPSVSMSKIIRGPDGFDAISFDTYTIDGLAADVIEPALRGIRMSLGPDMTEAALRGESILPFGEEGSGLEVARWIARAIIRRNDPPERIPIPGIPECGSDCFCRRGD